MHLPPLLLLVVSSLLVGVLGADDIASSPSALPERPFTVQFRTLLHREPYARRLRVHLQHTLGLLHVQVSNLQPNPLTPDELRAHLLTPDSRLLYLGRAEGSRPGMLLATPVADDTWALLTAHKLTSTLPTRFTSHGYVTVSSSDEVRQALTDRAREQEGWVGPGHVVSLDQVLEYVAAL